MAVYRTFDKAERFTERIRPAANQLCRRDFFEHFSVNDKKGMNRLGSKLQFSIPFLGELGGLEVLPRIAKDFPSTKVVAC